MREHLSKRLLDLMIILVIPLMILSPNLFATGFSVASLLGGEDIGFVRAYLLSALLSLPCELGAVLLRRDWSHVAINTVVMSVLSGLLAFWFVDGFWYAFKASALTFVQALMYLGSALCAMSLFRLSVLQGMLLSFPEAHRRAQQEALSHPGMAKVLLQGAALLGLTTLLFGGIKMLVAFHVVTAPFGTGAFNGRVVFFLAVMFVPGLLFRALAAVLSVLLLERRVNASTDRRSVCSSLKASCGSLSQSPDLTVRPAPSISQA